MAASLTEIREAVAEALKVIPGLDAFAWMKANPTPPSAHVYPDSIEYDQTQGRGHDNVYLIVQAFVGILDDRGAQERLDRMLAPDGPDSIKAALEADRYSAAGALGGLVDDIHVESCTGYRTYPRPQGDLVLGAEWRVLVLASG